MTFLSRMRTETGAPMPRYLYLLDKPAHTAGLALALHAITGLAWWPAAWLAAAGYVLVGLVCWWGPRARRWDCGPGGIPGDALYHALPSSLVPLLLLARPWNLGAVGLALACWWLLDGAGYGPMRAP